MRDRTRFPEVASDPPPPDEGGFPLDPGSRDGTLPSPPGEGLSRREFLQRAGVAGAGLTLVSPGPGRGSSLRERLVPSTQSSQFAVRFEDGAVTSLRYASDTFDTDYAVPGARLGDVVLRFRQGEGPWQSLETGGTSVSRRIRSNPDGSEHGMTAAGAGDNAPEVDVDFAVDFICPGAS